ncbi:MAG: type II secretion system protein [Verrucomicrobia bacterium]|nr:type II secretion system protein [Verrucomicrobiota bacterium]
MTFFEVVIVLMVILFLAVFFLPGLLYQSRGRGGHARISCLNNLKQLGLAYKIWSGDNNDRYPMDVSTAGGGTKEWMNTPDAWKTYLQMSNELSTPKILFCPEDTSRGTIPTDWNDALKNKLSYFIGLDASDTNSSPSVILSGDGNFLLNNAPSDHGFVNASTNASLTWDDTRHLSDSGWFKPRTIYGNIGLCDGSVQACTSQGLNVYLQQTGFATNRFFVP